jgi:lauroyl/myristoyl acyltransferase/membrane protease YdiL (CAAX protease family)
VITLLLVVVTAGIIAWGRGYRCLWEVGFPWAALAAVPAGLAAAYFSLSLTSLSLRGGGRKLLRALMAVSDRKLLLRTPAVPHYLFVSAAEELLWRGTLQEQFSRPWVGIPLVALVFTVLHVFVEVRKARPIRMLDLLIFALLLGSVFHITGNIYAVVILHFIRNMVLLGLRGPAAKEPAPPRARPGRRRADPMVRTLSRIMTWSHLLPAETAYSALVSSVRAAVAGGEALNVRVFAGRRRRVLGNIRLAYPHAGEAHRRLLYRRTREHAVRKLVEDILLLRMEIGRLRTLVGARCRIEGDRHLREALAAGRGMILGTCHLGAMTYVMPVLMRFRERLFFGRTLYFTNKRSPTTGGLVDERVREAEAMLPVRFVEVPVNRQFAAARTMLRVLRGGGVLVIACDGDLYTTESGRRKTAFTVNFLGGRIRVGGGAAWLSAATGLPVVPVFAVRDRRYRIRLCFETPIGPARGRDRSAVRALNDRIFAKIEEYVRRHPEQWLFWDRLHLLRVGS